MTTQRKTMEAIHLPPGFALVGPYSCKGTHSNGVVVVVHSNASRRYSYTLSLHIGNRQATTSSKYGIDKHAKFEGDARDQRSYLTWCSLWMAEALRVLKVGGYFLCFTDWRQLPTITDAIQCAGFTWRGIISWDKGLAARAPHKGYFRHQCEYVVWGTKGRAEKLAHDGPFPGSLTIPILPSEKQHQTAKPVALMEQLVRPVIPGGIILDPFAGSGTTGVAALRTGRSAWCLTVI